MDAATELNELKTHHAQVMQDVVAASGFVKKLLIETKLLEVIAKLKDKKWDELSFIQKAAIIKTVTGGVTGIFSMSEDEMDEMFPPNTMEIVERFIKYAETKH